MIENLDLTHKPLLDPLLRACNLQLSEYSFANLFMFREVHDYKLVKGEHLFIKGKTYDGLTFLMPTSQPGFKAALKDRMEGVDMLFPIPEEWVSSEAGYDDADSDYLFDAQKLEHYSGRHLSKKRNLVKQFLEQYQVVEKPFDKSQIPEALELLSIWQKVGDTSAFIVGLQHFNELNLSGMALYDGSKMVAIGIGEALRDDTYVIHFAKADIQYKGIYQYLYQVFIQSLNDRYKYINMEQDLGKPELRHAKHSYHPLSLLKKYRVRV